MSSPLEDKLAELRSAEAELNSSWEKTRSARAAIEAEIRANGDVVPDECKHLLSLKRSRKKLRESHPHIDELYAKYEIVWQFLSEEHSAELYQLQATITEAELRIDAIMRTADVLELEKQIVEAEEAALLEQAPTIVFRRSKIEEPDEAQN